MNEHLLRHAIDTVWCNPDQDRQFVYKLAKLTPRYGVRGAYSVNYEKFSLPSEKDYWHVYQIGKVVPIRLGLPRVFNQWMTLSSLANEHLVLTELYIESGIQFPRFESFIRIQPDRNVVIAVKTNDLIADLNDNALFCRFYTNAYFNTERSNEANRRFIKTEGIRVNTQTSMLQFQVAFNAAANELKGFPQCYVNGRFVQEVSLVTAGIGDVVEYVIDGSITGFRDFKLTECPTFTSTLDKTRKYIIHYDDPTVQSIRFYDDLDAFLFKPLPQAGRFMGVTYHRNKGDWLRMLTHKDYSLSIPRLQSFVEAHPDDPRNILDQVRWNKDHWDSVDQLTLRLYFRESGYNRPLIADANRIQELYKLNSDQIVNAMTGLFSTNPLWQAANLEQCPYVRFMSASKEVVYPLAFNNPDETNTFKDNAQAFAGDVYGYHAAASILAKTPSKVYLEGVARYADLAYEHWLNATVFEYDANGVLLGYHYHSGGRQYRVVNENAVLVEAITGVGGDRMNTVFGTGPVTIPTGYNKRLYLSSVWGGSPQGDWVDITEADNLSDYGYLDDTTEVHRWVWTLDPERQYGAVRIDDAFLIETLSFTKTNGLIQFSIGGIETHDTQDEYTVMEIPFGQLDVFLNGRLLIEELDYVVQWPRVVVNNLEYLEDTVQTVTYRGYSFCNDDLSRNTASEIGFIKQGVLSNNERYNIHSHKVQRVVVDGHFRDPASLVYSEELSALTVENERNGSPYVIQTPPVRFKDVYDSDKVARQEDDEKDRLVSDYMTEYWPVKAYKATDGIERQYHVYSVFANKILTDILSGRLNPTVLGSHYSEMDIRKWLSSYEWLLEFDLCNREYNETHVQILPHWFGSPQGLQMPKYDFFIRVLNLYLRKRPDVSPFVYVVR